MKFPAALAALFTVALAVAGCTAPGAPSTSASPSPTDDALASVIDDQTSLGDCEEQLGPFLAAMTEVDSRLNVGLSLAEYSERLGDARVAYDAIDYGAITGGCTNAVGVPLEDAYNLYVQSLTAWNDCMATSGCTLESIEPDMQAKWEDASEKIAAARTALGQ